MSGERSGAARLLDEQMLSGLKVVEFAHVIAGPLAGTLLADLGAEVVHVEDPVHGDPGRKQGPPKGDTYLWWKVSARNKRSVTLDLRTEKGQDLARRLAAWADVVIANVRPDTLERWGLDWARLHEANPQLVMLQVSGFGAKSSQRTAPGFGKVGEARSGVVHVTGFPDGPPVHTGFSHADTVTALMGAFAIQCALYRREVDEAFDGEWIDLALFESLYRLIEWQIIVHDQLGTIPGRAGNRLAVAPAAIVDTFASKDGEWITVTSGTPRSVCNIAELIGMPPETFETVEAQYANADHINEELRTWIADRTADDVLTTMAEAGATASRIFDASDILADDIYQELGDIITVEDAELGDVRMQGVIPRFERHPGRVWRTGPALGEDDELVYRDFLGLGDAELELLKSEGVVGAWEASA